jgi:hypothetical protein
MGQPMISNQLFGSIETADGLATAMLCIDSDKPNEFLFHWRHDGKGPAMGVKLNEPSNWARGLLMRAAWNGNQVSLKPVGLLRDSVLGGLYVPRGLTEDEGEFIRGMSATLQRSDAGGLSGSWSGPNNTGGNVQLVPPPTSTRVKARRLRTWTAFKAWADKLRADNTAAWFRGHGSNTFPLMTTFHRVGRTRLADRFFVETMQRFTAHAEATLGRRFNLDDGNDYATLMGLAQHHGVPTPLLDWTDSAYIAAFFAFADAIESRGKRQRAKYVRIFALSPDIPAAAPVSVVMSWPAPFVAPLSVAPLHNPRLYAQQGRFLVTNVVHFEGYMADIERKYKRPLLQAVDIPIGFASEALRDLAFMGLTAASLFPGLDGAGRMLRHEMSYDVP